MADTTEDQSWVDAEAARAAPVAGLVVVWTGRQPMFQVVEVGARATTLGRGDDADVAVDDRRMSRLHAEVVHGRDGWRVRDLDSHNGTFVDGVQLAGPQTFDAPRVVRTGDTLALALADVGPLRGGAVAVVDGIVTGPTLRAALDAIAAAARTGSIVHITGDSGSGKELAARRFHDAGDPAAPFVAVNCAAIPAPLAESLLFGVRKGAYSGADADRDGYLAAADGGTVFLDEIGELPLELQAKLLRVLETREVLAVGATRPRKLELRVVSATHQSLRALVADGRFREDLYYRVARPTVALPALRDRGEDLGFLAAATVRRIAPELGVHVTLVEQLLLRPWPGNARELIGELADAAGRALAAGGPVVTADHLDATAGMPFVDEPPAARALDIAAVDAALAASNGNVAAAARALGVHRTQLRRILAKRVV
jgi:transcriptional regulator with PAS, ATPase and Fis domain|nr:sigma 54-interacting transcriptional regulator [Kofleriaceae bacterium]